MSRPPCFRVLHRTADTHTHTHARVVPHTPQARSHPIHRSTACCRYIRTDPHTRIHFSCEKISTPKFMRLIVLSVFPRGGAHLPIQILAIAAQVCNFIVHTSIYISFPWFPCTPDGICGNFLANFNFSRPPLPLLSLPPPSITSSQ